MSDPNIPPPPGGTPPPPPPPPGGTPPPPPPPGGGFGAPPPPPPGGTPPPPPPPGGYGGYGAPPPAGGTPPPAGGFEAARLDLGASLQYGWKKFTENAGPLIVLMLAVGVAAVVIAVIVGLFQAGSTVRISGAGTIRIRPSFIGMLWNVALQVILSAIIVALGSIMLRAVLGITRGVAISTESVLKTDNVVPYVMTMVVIWVVPAAIQSFLSWIFFGLGILMIPVTFIWGIVMGFAPLLALDTGAEPVEALKKSMEWVTGDIATTGVIVLVTGIVSALGAIVCGVGLLVSIPVGMLGLAYAYRAKNNETVAI